MKATSDPIERPARSRDRSPPVPLTREFLTVVISTVALIVLCRLFAPSSIAYGALAGSLPFAAILAIVGLGQMLVVQQGGFDLSVAGGVSLAVVDLDSRSRRATTPTSCPRCCWRLVARSRPESSTA